MCSEGISAMRAVVFDGQIRYVEDHPVPFLRPGWARIRVKQAGICQTDLEITRGYMGFKGVLGHEFVGTVSDCADPAWLGKRVVGEINAACGQCDWCTSGLGRHCPTRTVLGILNLDGCLADYCMLPLANLLEVPPAIPNDRAVFVEPLSAACEILEQVPLNGNERVVVLGDGRLGILCSWVLTTAVTDVTLVGHHPEKLKLAAWRHLKTTDNIGDVKPGADIVVEATGSGRGLTEAMSLCRPRGTIVLKSTVAEHGDINLAPVVINEQTVLGSRCGQFKNGLRMMEAYPDIPLERLITARYPITRAVTAFQQAVQPETLKVLIEINM
ncbi:MAG: alcohol dehydrogenase catalytic domain-containing protein [Chloroflexota bacterium]